MRSLGTSDRPSVRALSRVIERVSSRTRARQFVRVMNRMGASPAAILPLVKDSPNFTHRRFEGEEPSLRPRVRAQTSALIAAIRVSGRGQPVGTVPVVPADPPQQPGELAVTWYGHATSVLEIDGARFLIDPVFSERVSPIRHAGPRRMHPVPGSIAQLPSIDAVLVSHDHYDHLDQPSVVRLEETHRPHYVVPLGVNAHLLAWGVPEDRITALDWRGETEVAGIRLTCTEARHNSGRGLVDSQTLWAGWALRGPRHSAYYAGDSGTSKRFAAIGADLGPFDLTLMPVGAYDPFWPDIHMDPEQALAAHRDVNRVGTDAEGATADQAGVADGFIAGDQRIDTPGGTYEEGEPTSTTRTVQTAARESLLVPVHWATFNLSMHWWAEPVRRLRRAAAEAQVPVAFPRVGERLDAAAGDAATVAAAHAHLWWEACAAPEDRD
ncbi:MBL fold metallo-hydrolase [Terrabacter sp. MAHUQ-38]|uniref:MBL fold metallo-hydrolase n=1 Tax=unclassified Terrabacter TaxID=2630222 RepID=UPI00165D6140|nr:MBL fold metallo-hydrolase [Terrabacter sp. MAHUQ-38]MBC9820847.1 MBL fold metallo-hydrolase [Terrabacter sp. MAHUQ-38]